MIFISYNRKNDGPLADQITSLLKRHGFTVWRDTSSIAPGEPFEDAITDAIRSSSLFIGMLSEEACESHHVKKEWSLAGGRSGELPILPIFLRGLAVEDLRGPMEYHGKSTQHLRLNHLDQAFEQRLIDSVHRLLNTTAPQVPRARGGGAALRVPGIWFQRFVVGLVALLALFGAVEWVRRTVGPVAVDAPGPQAPETRSSGPLAPPETVPPAQPVKTTPDPAPPPPAIQGAWDFTTTVETSRYKPYVGLVSVYRISLFRLADGRVSGNGELWSERGEEVVGRNHLPIAFEGAQDGDTIHLTFRVESVNRPVTGGAELHWDRETAQWTGTFYSGAGASKGAAVLSAR